MGLNIGFSSSKHDDKSVSFFSKYGRSRSSLSKETNYSKSLPNPRPDNYKIIKYLPYKRCLLVKVKYLDCTNYEGNKILLFKDCTINKLKKQGLIDPHFSENKKFHSPIARFEPTIEGWNIGLKMLGIIGKQS